MLCSGAQADEVRLFKVPPALEGRVLRAGLGQHLRPLQTALILHQLLQPHLQQHRALLLQELIH